MCQPCVKYLKSKQSYFSAYWKYTLPGKRQYNGQEVCSHKLLIRLETPQERFGQWNKVLLPLTLGTRGLSPVPQACRVRCYSQASSQRLPGLQWGLEWGWGNKPRPRISNSKWLAHPTQACGCGGRDEPQQLLDSAEQRGGFLSLPAGPAYTQGVVRGAEQSTCFHLTLWLPILLNKAPGAPKNEGPQLFSSLSTQDGICAGAARGWRVETMYCKWWDIPSS